MAILLLLEDEPMHPYGIRQRIQAWDKDRTVNVTQPNAVYQTVERLRRDELIRLREVTRLDNRPDRTVYETTPAGTSLAHSWLTDLLAVPAAEFPAFPAALAFVQSLPRGAVIAALEKRADTLRFTLEQVRQEVATRTAEVPGGVDRIHLIEVEYLQAMWAAEIAWVTTLVDDLHHNRVWPVAES